MAREPGLRPHSPGVNELTPRASKYWRKINATRAHFVLKVWLKYADKSSNRLSCPNFFLHPVHFVLKYIGQRADKNDRAGGPKNMKPLLGRCWIETGYKGRSHGYLRVRYQGRQQQGHRIAYEVLVGPIPAGQTIDHLCWVKDCLNPQHMELVTRSENGRRASIEGGQKWHKRMALTHCKHGHERAVYGFVNSQGNRVCRACQRAADKKYDQKRRKG